MNNLLADNGLQKIFGVVRKELQELQSKEMFLKNVENRFDSFFSAEEIHNRIKTKLWNDLEEKKCNYLCPWCGMPCCGASNCNDLYVPYGVPSTVKAKSRHSCQFHRDPSITGVTELINGIESNRLPNKGDCPQRKENKQVRIITDPKNKDQDISVDYTYYDTTWNITPRAENPEQGFGYFWQWFLSFVSSESNLVNPKLGIYLSFKKSC